MQKKQQYTVRAGRHVYSNETLMKKKKNPTTVKFPAFHESAAACM